MAVFLYGITGRFFSARELELFEAIWVFTSYPDARIWNNRVVALGASARSTASLSLSAGLAASEARLFGQHPFYSAFVFLERISAARKTGQSLECAVATYREARRRVFGYGRPITAEDERLKPLHRLASRLHLAGGHYYQLALDVEQILLRDNPGLKLNYAGAVAALCGDIGLNGKDLYMFTYPAFLAGMPPCFIDAAGRPPFATLPMSIADIGYEGPAPRRWMAS